MLEQAYNVDINKQQTYEKIGIIIDIASDHFWDFYYLLNETILVPSIDDESNLAKNKSTFQLTAYDPRFLETVYQGLKLSGITIYIERLDEKIVNLKDFNKTLDQLV